MVRSIVIAALLVPILAAAPRSGRASPSSTQGPRVVDDEADILFADNFSRDLSHWEVHGEDAIRIRDSGDPTHGSVLELVPNGDVLVLIPQLTYGANERASGLLGLQPRSVGGPVWSTT